MNKTNILIVILLLLSLANISAEGDYLSLFDDLSADSESISDDNAISKSPMSDDFTTGNDFTLTLKGDHQFWFHVPVVKDHINFNGYMKSPKLVNDIGISIEYKSLYFISEWQLDLIMNEWGDWTQLLEARPLENAIYWSPWKFKFGVGFQNYSWGTGDGFNPTDNLNPRDFRTFDMDKIPVLSVSVAFYPTDFMSMQVVYIPFEQQDLFPIDFGGYLQASLAPMATIVTTKPLSFDPTAFVIGGKINFFFRYADFSISYLSDIEPFYTPVYSFTNNTIDLVRKRVHRFGADIRVNAGPIGIFGEACYTMSEDWLMNSDRIRNHKLSWVVGIDFNYGPDGAFYVNLQYMMDFVPFYDAGFYKDYQAGLPDPLRMADKSYMERYYYRFLTNSSAEISEGMIQSIILAMEWPVLDSLLTPSLYAIYFIPLIYDYDREIRLGSLILAPELNIKPIDSLNICIGANVFLSWIYKDNTAQLTQLDKVGSYFKESNIYFAVKYKWGFDLRK